MEVNDLKARLVRPTGECETISRHKASLLEDNTELRASCFESQSQIFEIGREYNFRKNASRDASQNFPAYEKQASKHIQGLLAQRTAATERHA